MKGLIRELPPAPQAQVLAPRHPAVAARCERAHPVWEGWSHGLSDATADVVAGHHRRPEAKFVDQAGDASRLRIA